MRWKLIVTGVVVALVSSTLAADAGVGVGVGTSPISCQTSSSERIVVSGVSQYRTLQGLTTSVNSIYPVTVTLSLLVQGKPAKVKIVDKWVAGNEVASPGAITLTPVNGQATPFTFTFIAPGSSAAEKGHVFKVRWRRVPSTGISTVLEGVMSLSYTTSVCTGSWTKS